MVACSSYVDQKVVTDIKISGFDSVFLAPLGISTIVDEIFPYIEMREKQICHQKNINFLINSNMDISLNGSIEGDLENSRKEFFIAAQSIIEE